MTTEVWDSITAIRDGNTACEYHHCVTTYKVMRSNDRTVWTWVDFSTEFTSSELKVCHEIANTSEMSMDFSIPVTARYWKVIPWECVMDKCGFKIATVLVKLSGMSDEAKAWLENPGI